MRVAIKREVCQEAGDEIDRLILYYIFVVQGSNRCIPFTRYCRHHQAVLGDPSVHKSKRKTNPEYLKFIQARNRRTYLLSLGEKLVQVAQAELENNPNYFQGDIVNFKRFLNKDEDEDVGDKQIPAVSSCQSPDVVHSFIAQRSSIQPSYTSPSPPQKEKMSGADNKYKWMVSVGNHNGVPQFKLNFDEPWQNMFGWFPTYTPKDDDDDSALLDYITLSKPIIDDRDPLPLIRRVRDNEHALHVTEINVPEYLRNTLDIHLYYGMMMVESPDTDSYRKKTMQVHLNKFLEENGHPAVSLESLMVQYELITPTNCPLTTHGFGNTDKKINIVNSITTHGTKEGNQKEQDFVYCHVAVRDASLKYKDDGDRNPISKLRERMSKLTNTAAALPDTSMSS